MLVNDQDLHHINESVSHRVGRDALDRIHGMILLKVNLPMRNRINQHVCFPAGDLIPEREIIEAMITPALVTFLGK